MSDTEPTEVDPVAMAEASLVVAKLERRLVELKDNGDSEELREVKDLLREARRELRTMRDPERAAADAEAAVMRRALAALASDPEAAKVAIRAGREAAEGGKDK